jgi:uncharacterized membrane protein YgdD (TMEM256/DUF423 family)
MPAAHTPTPSAPVSAAHLWLAAGAANGFLSVALEAYAAHGLSGRLSEAMLAVFEKGVQFQRQHGLALLATGILLLLRPDVGPWRWAAALFLAGILLFSGSLYLLALTGTHFWGAVTPFGGVSFLLGWVALGLGAWRLGPTAPRL